MLQDTINRLAYLVTTIPSRLRQLDESDFAYKLSPEKWSKQEVLGHLIDSASHNHYRIVHAQFEQSFTLTYAQNEWVKYNHYQSLPATQVIDFWTVYNRQLLLLLQQIPDECLNNQVNGQTLSFIIIDYVAHMEHHLLQMGIEF